MIPGSPSPYSSPRPKLLSPQTALQKAVAGTYISPFLSSLLRRRWLPLMPKERRDPLSTPSTNTSPFFPLETRIFRSKASAGNTRPPEVFRKWSPCCVPLSSPISFFDPFFSSSKASSLSSVQNDHEISKLFPEVHHASVRAFFSVPPSSLPERIKCRFPLAP